MARSTRTVQSERDFVRNALRGVTPAKVDALLSAWEDVIGEPVDLDLRDVLNVGLHNLAVIAHRDPAYKARRAERGLATARAAKESGAKVQISPNVSPRSLAYMIGSVESIDGQSVTVKGWDGKPQRFAASLILPYDADAEV